jgi:serine/threonine-protein kinase
VRGAALAVGAGVGGFALLLYPGLKTPAAARGGEVFERIAAPGPPPAAALPAQPAGGPLDQLLRLSPRFQQALSDSLAAFEQSEPRPVREPRALIGAPDAPVRITEFTDPLCSHCATLHRTLGQLRERVPVDSLALESRQFPLDGACNPQVPQRASDPIRCVAARAMICMEGRPESFDFASKIFEHQDELSANRIYGFAEPAIERAELRRCMAAEETEAKLQDDIAWALEHEIRGTPLVLLNGREAPAVDVFLYAMVLTLGDEHHPIFEKLPTPRSQARHP